jgi:hypothetical protein
MECAFLNLTVNEGWRNIMIDSKQGWNLLENKLNGSRTTTTSIMNNPFVRVKSIGATVDGEK